MMWTYCDYFSTICGTLDKLIFCRKKYKYKKRARVFPAVTASGSSQALSSSDAPKPLEGMRFVIGKTSKSKEELTGMIVSMGGKVVNRVDQRTTAVISSKGELLFVTRFRGIA